MGEAVGRRGAGGGGETAQTPTAFLQDGGKSVPLRGGVKNEYDMT